jgi:hypothetical protein
MILAAILWLLGSLFILMTMEAEQEDQTPIVILAFAWPLFTVVIMIQHLLGPKEED